MNLKDLKDSPLAASRVHWKAGPFKVFLKGISIWISTPVSSFAVPHLSYQTGVPRNLTAKRPYRGTSLARRRTPLGPYRRPMPRVVEAS